GESYERTRRTVALCRCGKSRIKPLCDGAHKVAGFESGPGVQVGSGASDSTGPSSELSPSSQQPSSRSAKRPSR
nr:CDGSH iron-sulfur domain-containing protein [Thermoleophilaceae bacterium]